MTATNLRLADESRFWDRIADRYATKPIADEASYQKKLEITREYFRPDMKVLEFGCGTGSTALIHAPHVASIRAIDVSARMLEIAKDKANNAGISNVHFEQSTLSLAHEPAGTYDMILGLSILHLLEDRDDAIARAFGLLKPGGVFVSSTPCLDGAVGWLFRLIGPIGRWLGLLPRLKVFSQNELRASMTSAGFVIDHSWQPDGARSLFLVVQKPY